MFDCAKEKARCLLSRKQRACVFFSFNLYTRGSALIVHESLRAPPPCLYVEIANHFSDLLLQIYAPGSEKPNFQPEIFNIQYIIGLVLINFSIFGTS